MASNLDEIRRELRTWRGTLKGRRRAEKQARVRFVRARRAAHNALRHVRFLERKARNASGQGPQAALNWCAHHLYITEQPSGSNCDNRADGIRTWMHRLGFNCGVPWCGIFAGNALLHAGVQGVSSRIASVALIEDDARAGRGPFKGWGGPGSAKPGDLVVLFGRGVHVETVRRIFPRLGFMYTDGGNTSSGNSGSQSNGGGSFPKTRPFSQVHGIAHVRY